MTTTSEIVYRAGIVRRDNLVLEAGSARRAHAAASISRPESRPALRLRRMPRALRLRPARSV
jgi:hypothetical protein